MSADQPLVVVTPWYPNDRDPFAGAFVRASVLGLRDRHPDVVVIHVENVAEDDTRPPTRYHRDGVEVVWIGVPTNPMTSRADMARNQRRALEAAMPPELARATHVHVHVGMPTGYAVAGLLPKQARMVLTEHATYLGKVFKVPAARDMYAEAMARSSAVTAVSEFLARSIRVVVPEQAHKVHSVPNVVPLQDIPFRQRPAGPLRRWLYVGRLVPAKGVERLVRAFAQAAAAPGAGDMHLTLVGEGPAREHLVELATELGVRARVDLLGAVPPDRVPVLMGEADVLVHLAHLETFGLTMVEAVANGLPVVATRSGGPQESLAEAVVLDRVRLVDVGEDVRSVLHAVADLERSLPGGDPVRARAQIERRYSAATAVRRLNALLDGDDAHDPGEVPMTIFGVSLNPSAQRSLSRMVQALVELGGSAVVATTRPAAFSVFGPAVTVVDLSPIERRFLPHAVERVVVSRLPLRAITVARNVVAGVQRRAPEPLASRLRARVDSANRLMTRYATFAASRHPRLYARAYDQISPWWLARRAWAGPLGEIPLDDIDLVVTPDWRATPFAWRFARQRPGIEVRRPMSRQQVARVVLSRETAPPRAG